MNSTFQHIRNVYCIGRNYALHAKELGNAVPSKPMVFMKPTHALAEAKGTLTFPIIKGEIHHELELVVKLGKDYDSTLSATDMIDEFSLGLDFTLRDIQSELKDKGHPWLIAKGFPNSAVLTPWIEFHGQQQWEKLEFCLEKNGNVVQQGSPKDMIFNLDALLHYIGRELGLKSGDIIFTGTPAGVGPIAHSDKIVMKLNKKTHGSFTVVLI